MHAANLEKSDRLRRVHEVLMDGNSHSTRDLIREAKACAINSIVAELRTNGIDISCHRVGNIWWYRMGVKS